MCGRYGFFLPISEAAALLDVVPAPHDQWVPRYNAAPTQGMPVVTNEFPGVLQFLRWGLVPAWAKDPAIGSKMINTRVESIMEKPAFKNICKYRRCVVPANGYYEWQQSQGGKGTGQPHFISAPDAPLLLMAGLWSHWGQQGLQTFSIVTRPAAGPLAALHHRMPVFLTDTTRRQWLSQGADNTFWDVLHTAAPVALQAQKVGPLVNKVSNEGPALLEAPKNDIPVQGTLF